MRRSSQLEPSSYSPMALEWSAQYRSFRRNCRARNKTIQHSNVSTSLWSLRSNTSASICSDARFDFARIRRRSPGSSPRSRKQVLASRGGSLRSWNIRSLSSTFVVRKTQLQIFSHGSVVRQSTMWYQLISLVEFHRSSVRLPRLIDLRCASTGLLCNVPMRLSRVRQILERNAKPDAADLELDPLIEQYTSVWNHLEMESGLVKHSNDRSISARVVVSARLREKVIRSLHLPAHHGYESTLPRISQRFWWPRVEVISPRSSKTVKVVIKIGARTPRRARRWATFRAKNRLRRCTSTLSEAKDRCLSATLRSRFLL